MKKRTSFLMAAGSSIGAALLLAACGGGGGDSSPPAPTDPLVSGTDVPTSATSSSAGAFAFVSLVAAAPADSAEPLVVGNATLATSETDEPSPI